MNVRRKSHTAREVEVLQAATSWARYRGWTHDTLPKGRRNSADECPLANATGCLVSTSLYAPPGDGPLAWLMLPERVAQFVTFFDMGHYPELELK